MHNPSSGAVDVSKDISIWLRRSREVLGTPWLMHLQCLDVRGVNDHDFSLLHDILKACSKSLRELELDASHFYTQYALSSSKKPTHSVTSHAVSPHTRKLESYIPLSSLSLTKLTIHSTLRFLHLVVLIRLGLVSSLIASSTNADSDIISYFSSLREIGALLSSIPNSNACNGTPPNQGSTLARTDAQSPLITLVAHIHEPHTPGAPTLADVDFSPLDFSSFGFSSDTLRVAINATKKAKLAEIIPHLNQNAGLREMVDAGQVVVMVGECYSYMGESEGKSEGKSRLCVKGFMEGFEVHRFGNTY